MDEYEISIPGVLYSVNKLSSDISVFDLEQGKMIKTIDIKIEPHEITALRNPNVVIITNYGDQNSPGHHATIINGETHQIDSTVSLGKALKPHGIVVIPNTRNVAIVNDLNSEVLILNTKSKKIEKQFSTTQRTSHLLAFHPVRELIFTSNMESNTVSVINSNNGDVLKIITCQKNTEGIDISPDGKELWITNSSDNTIQIIETDKFEIINTIPSGKRPLRVKFTNDGKFCFVTNTADGTVSIFDTQNKKEVSTIRLPGNNNFIDKILNHTPRPVGIAMHPNGKYAFISNSNANKIEVIDIEKKIIVSRIKVGDIPDGIVVL